MNESGEFVLAVLLLWLGISFGWMLLCAASLFKWLATMCKAKARWHNAAAERYEILTEKERATP